MSLWPSRGIYLHGFEIKVYRNDWLRELKTPAKAEPMATRCDFWWVVVGGPDIATADEMPDAWGLLELTGRGLVTRKAAVARSPAPELDRNLVASILRGSTETMIPRAAISGAIEDARKEGREQGKLEAGYESGATPRALEAIRGSVAAFESASGVSIDTYGAGKIGTAVRQVLTLEGLRLDWRMEQAENALALCLESVRKARSESEVTHG